jgi:hypothetical protein
MNARLSREFRKSAEEPPIATGARGESMKVVTIVAFCSWAEFGRGDVRLTANIRAEKR